MGLIRCDVRTAARCQFLDVTAELRRQLRAQGWRTGVLTVFVPHTTAGVLINENADPDVCRDLLGALARLAPAGAPEYRHAEGNSDAHLKACLVGASAQVPVEDGDLGLGTWQAVYFAEFDGPRQRQFWLTFTPGP
jgi:secondary thiamine-phosphate synthase enzyme